MLFPPGSSRHVLNELECFARPVIFPVDFPTDERPTARSIALMGKTVCGEGILQILDKALHGLHRAKTAVASGKREGKARHQLYILGVSSVLICNRDAALFAVCGGFDGEVRVDVNDGNFCPVVDTDAVFVSCSCVQVIDFFDDQAVRRKNTVLVCENEGITVLFKGQCSALYIDAVVRPERVYTAVRLNIQVPLRVNGRAVFQRAGSTIISRDRQCFCYRIVVILILVTVGDLRAKVPDGVFHVLSGFIVQAELTDAVFVKCMWLRCFLVLAVLTDAPMILPVHHLIDHVLMGAGEDIDVPVGSEDLIALSIICAQKIK